MKIQVKQQHIDQGKRKDGQSCAIALALKENGFSHFHVELERIVFYEDGCYREKAQHKFPLHIKSLISYIDNGCKHLVSPFEFEINPK